MTLPAIASWRLDAACAAPDVDPAWFFPVDLRGNGIPDFVPPEATAVCRRCPVRDECLRYALANNEAGVWAGTSEQQRQRLARAAQRNRRLA